MESDLSLITRIKNSNDETSLSELIERHSGIYIQIVEHFLNNSKMKQFKEMVLQDKDLTIYNSALNYDPSRLAKFPTYLANAAKWKCLNLINQTKKKKECDLDSAIQLEISDDGFLIDIDKAEAFQALFDALEQEKDPRVKKIIDFRYNSDNNKLTPWREIAKKMNLSIQGCINIHDNFIKNLKKKLK